MFCPQRHRFRPWIGALPGTEFGRCMAEKVALISLGCPKNLVDSEMMLGQLKTNGYELTTDAADADVIVVNTCGFLGAAAQESIDALLEARPRIAPSVGPTHGVQAIANATPISTGPPRPARSPGARSRSAPSIPDAAATRSARRGAAGR